jgi:hypothetical protein
MACGGIYSVCIPSLVQLGKMNLFQFSEPLNSEQLILQPSPLVAASSPSLNLGCYPLHYKHHAPTSDVINKEEYLRLAWVADNDPAWSL